jgi:hypothetical protein
MRTSTFARPSFSPTRLDLTLLEHAQELHLQGERQLADLVEEQRPAARPPRRARARSELRR